MPIAMIVKAASLLEHAGEFDAAGAHVIDVRLRAGVAIFEGSRRGGLGLAPEDFAQLLNRAIRVEGLFDLLTPGIDVDQIDAMIRQILQLLQTVATIDDAGVEQGRRLAGVGCRCGVSVRGRLVSS